MEEKHKVNRFNLYQTCIQRDLFTLPLDKKKKIGVNTLLHRETNLVIDVVVYVYFQRCYHMSLDKQYGKHIC